MLDSKFFFTLVGLVVAVFAICNTNISPPVAENFGMGRTVKFVRDPREELANKCRVPANNNCQYMVGNENTSYPFISRPNFQGLLSPRAASLNYGANIKYNMPSYNNQGVPRDPLAMADMAHANYNGASSQNYGCGGKESVSNNSDDNYVSSMNNVYESNKIAHISDGVMSVGDMTTINSLGEASQPIVYNHHYIYANQKSRLRRHGDPIRGDIAIPFCRGNWFSVSVNPDIDLQQGAMNVMGGIKNESTQALGALVYESSGKSKDIVAGVQLTNDFITSMSAGGGDISVGVYPTAFP